jgi:hypothetical protein
LAVAGLPNAVYSMTGCASRLPASVAVVTSPCRLYSGHLAVAPLVVSSVAAGPPSGMPAYSSPAAGSVTMFVVVDPAVSDSRVWPSHRYVVVVPPEVCVARRPNGS